MSTPRVTFVDRSTDTGELCPGVAVTLDTWLARSWDDGVETEALEELATLRVRTRNSAYELVFVSAPAGHVLVRGGRYFPEWTRVCFLGCSAGGSLLKRHAVHLGLRLEFWWVGRRIVTSPVVSVSQDATPRTSAAC